MTITTLPAAEEIREMRQLLYGGKSPMLGFGSGFQVVFVRHCDDCLAVLAPGRHVVQDELETEALKHLATSGNIPGYLVFLADDEAPLVGLQQIYPVAGAK